MKTAPLKFVRCPTASLNSASCWVRHFRRDLARDWQIPWSLCQTLSGATRSRIAASIAEFQRGESSEALSYLAKSEQYSRRMNDPAFHEASRLFVTAENAHADILLQFMRRNGISPKKGSMADSVFRWLRGISDLGWTSRVILVAELVAQEYYPCLLAATDDPALKRICQRVIAEEAAHIRFQVDRIVAVETQLRRVSVPREILQMVLLGGTAAVVYAGHSRVLSTRLSAWQFLVRLWGRHRRALAKMRALRALARRDPRTSVLKMNPDLARLDSV